MQVRDAMTREVTTVREDDSLAQALQLMVWKSIRHLPVLRDGKLVGVLSERDVLASRGGRSIYEIEGQVGSAMSAEVQTAKPEDDLEVAAARMAEGRFDCLPVMEGPRVVGILTTTDVLQQVTPDSPPEAPDVASWDASSIMTSRVIAVMPGDDLLDAAGRMVQYGIRHLPVIDGQRQVVGIVSDRDIRSLVGDPRAALDEDSHLEKVSRLKVSDAMTNEPRTVFADTPLSELAALIEDQRIGAVPVVDENDRLLGIVSYLDVLRTLRRAL